MLAYEKIYPKLENSMKKKKNSRKGKQFDSHVQDYEHNSIHKYKTSFPLIFKLNELKEEI